MLFPLALCDNGVRNEKEGTRMIGDYPMPPMQWRQQYPQYPQPMRQQPADGATLIFVANVKDIDGVTVQPGQRVFAMAQNEPVLACREANAMGVVQTTYCRLEPYEPTAPKQNTDYVTRAEFEELVRRIQGKETSE